MKLDGGTLRRRARHSTPPPTGLTGQLLAGGLPCILAGREPFPEEFNAEL
ncbi:MAG: hypothetical protein M3O15_15165 [Acidobacteriota bacterium]|nr:hypothetical protein [Acidobacteriota bacterium]